MREVPHTHAHDGRHGISDGLTLRADYSAMGTIGAAIALAQYPAILTAIGGLARLSMLLAVRGVQLWQEDALGPEQRIR